MPDNHYKCSPYNASNVDVIYYLDKAELDKWGNFNRVYCIKCNSEIFELSIPSYYNKKDYASQTDEGYRLFRFFCPKCYAYYAEKELTTLR